MSTQNNQPISVGQKVALASHLDLWMAGVRFGEVSSIEAGSSDADTGYGILANGRVYWLDASDFSVLSEAEPTPSLCTCADYTESEYHADWCPVSNQVTYRLVGWGDDAEFIKGYVLPRVFGHLVRLAAPVVQEYHSDLYRDAEWLPKNVTGPCEMDFVVRPSGTHLGRVGGAWNMARTYMGSPSNWTKSDRFYRLALTVDERREWWLTITDVTPWREDKTGTHGRCDTCGAAMNQPTCPVDTTHAVALP